MGKKTNRSQGFTLIAALLILVLLSGVAAGLLFLVTNEARMSGNDQEANLAFYGAESGMEKLDSDLASLYQSYMVPTTQQIQGLTTYPPSASSVPSMTYSEQICFPTSTGCVATNNATAPPSNWNTVSAGSNQGLYAEIVPMNLQITATRPSGASANITRKVEVALIPVFQFGVFCGYDCSYFPGPDFSFGGRVHTNQNLFLGTGGNLVFNDKVQAYSQVVMDQLENGWPTSNGYTGTVYLSKAYNGCPLNSFPPPTGTNCASYPVGDASYSGGYPGITGSVNGSFQSTYSGLYNYYVANSTTGVSNLQLKFIQNSCVSNPPGSCTDAIAIVRKPVPLESPVGTLGSERLYNKAQIRILLSDDPLDLHPDRGAAPMDAQDVCFPNSATAAALPCNAPFSAASVAAVSLTAGGTEPVGFATVGSNGWVNPYTDSGIRAWGGVNNIPLIGELTNNPAAPTNMNGPWIRVEICTTAPCNVATNWVGVTQEWLRLGFSRIFNNPPTTPGSNAIDPNAILILQQLRPAPAVAQTAASAHGTAAAVGGNFYPINFYDTREGEMRDNNVANTNTGSGATASTYSSCSVNGIMNAVELDVGNLARWLNGSIPGSGNTVNYNSENGYVLYFSDHRGMIVDPNASTTDAYNPRNPHSGVSGIEDVINSAQVLTSTTTDNALEAASYYTYSPEDVDQNSLLDNWGEKNIGYGFGINTNTSPLNPFKRINVTGAGTTGSVDCASYNTSTGALLTNAGDQQGMANPVSGARHVLKLVDGGMSATLQSSLPVMPAASGCAQTATNPTACGGFTIASENPVYIQGNYNSQANDPFWTTANNVTPTQTPHSAASIIADSVTLLSNTWSDMGSLMFPTVPGNRTPAANAYYRTAIAGGKNIPFPQPGWSGVSKDFGTDGGLHNFLRYLENWGNVSLNYDGSLVSMYYSEYDTGTFKCCTTVYSPPTRKYYFDVLFLNPNNLPPATPEFQDVVNLSYHQNFTPR